MSIEAGVVGGVELGEFSLGAVIGLGASMDSLSKELRRNRKIEEAYEFGATNQPLRASAVSPADGSFVLDLGGPSYGRFWEVKRLTVGGALWSATIAGSALAVIASVRSLTPALSDIADVAGSLPSVATYGTRQFVLRHPDHLFVVFLTPTASTQYAVGGAATDYPDRRLPITTTD